VAARLRRVPPPGEAVLTDLRESALKSILSPAKKGRAR
jgi:hypothetical protein